MMEGRRKRKYSELMTDYGLFTPSELSLFLIVLLTFVTMTVILRIIMQLPHTDLYTRVTAIWALNSNSNSKFF